ncbi:PQQ-binding-like beta-propeller repeat protein [Halomicroarcula sp. F13]|uniref:PQQ-binding-like beta-propeller repeat protein n=1 Tax=Haloarcula rubra TaxID=2487747 RepID=A0AAW4PX79_9EURY|nr:PQQ-binding-like beta-propeller repeat protein [Halomicroarcula rubra]MBX0325231.1 PQQ-binding-like beta-propeller repeat protein [Halomicroarcula rubra]
MGAPEPDRSYSEVTQFSLGTDTMLAADTSAVVVATPSGRLTVINDDGRSTVSVDGPVDAVAAERYLFTLSDETVRATTTSGIELWTTPVEAATAIAPVGAGGVLACVTDDGRVVGLDTETGTKLYSAERPHTDVSELAAIVGGHGRVVVAAWSFLTAFDDTGEVLFDRNLDGAIAQVAVLETAVVVRLKDGRLVRLAMPDANQVWRQDTDARDITALRNDVIVIDDDGLRYVDEHGTVDQLSLPGGDAVTATNEGSFIVTGDGGTQTVFQQGVPAAAALNATVLTDRARADESIRVQITNTGPGRVEASPSVETDASTSLQLDDDHRSITLDSDESTEITVPVKSVDESGEATVTVAVDGTTIGDGIVETVRYSDPATVVDVEAALKRVTEDGAAVVVTVSNSADVPVNVAFEGATDTVQPGDEGEVSTTVPLENDADYSLSVTLDDQSADIPVPVSLPSDRPSLTITAGGDQSNPFLDVLLEAPFEATLTGTLVIEADERLHIERDLELPGGSRFQLVVPLTESVIASGMDVTTRLSGHDLSERTSLSVEAWDRGSETETVPSHGGTEATDAPGRSGQIGAQGHTADSKDDSPSTLTDSPNATLTPSLHVEREAPESIQRGQRFTETVIVTNVGTRTASDITIALGDQQYRIDRLEPDQRFELERDHALFDVGEAEVADGTVAHDGTSKEVPPHTLTVEPGPILARVTTNLHGQMTALSFECTNTGDQPCRIGVLGVNPHEGADATWTLDDSPELEPGGTLTIERQTDRTDLASAAPFVAGVRYVTPDTDPTSYWTLAAQGKTDNEVSGTGNGTAQTSNTALRLGAQPRSPPMVGRNSAIECTLTAGTTVTDLTVEAVGDAVTPLSTGERDIGRIAAGDAENYVVDIEPTEQGTASFTLTTSGSTQEGDVDHTYRVSGPIAEDAGEDVADEWSVTRTDSQSSDDERADEEVIDDGQDTLREQVPPTHLVTSCRAPEGSPR